MCHLNNETGSRGYVGTAVLFCTNFRSGTPARRQVTSIEICAFRGKVGGIISIEIGLKVSIIRTIRGTGEEEFTRIIT